MIRYKRIYVHTLTLYKEIQTNTFTYIKRYNHTYQHHTTYIHTYIHHTYRHTGIHHTSYIPTYIHAARPFSARMAANYRGWTSAASTAKSS